MNSKIKPNANRIINWLEEQREGYSKLLGVLEMQKVAALEEDEGKLLQTIHEKERILSNLLKKDKMIKLEAQGLDKQQHEELIKSSQSLRDEIESILRKTLALETFCENYLENKKSSLRDQMKTTKHGRSVLKGYGSASLQHSRFSKNA